MNRSFLLFSAAVALATGAYLALNPSTQAAPKLLPFQGRLTSANGVPVADGAKVVQFKIYNAPTGGTAVWNGEVQKVTVNGGLVSTLLGSKAEFTSAVDFNQALYLEITVDANGDNQINPADPPLLPRQSILPAVFAVEADTARNANKLKATDGSFHDWSAIFGAQNPSTGTIAVNRVNISAGSINGVSLVNNTVGSAAIGVNAVTVSELASDAVTNAKLAASAVTTDKILNGTIALVDLGTEVNARFAAIESRLTALEAGLWTPLSDSLGALPFATTTEAGYDLPATVPSTAKQVLVFARVLSGFVPDVETTMKIYSKQGSTQFACWLYCRAYPQEAVAFNSSVFWIPVTADRKIYAKNEVAVPSSNLTSGLHVIGYK